MKSEGLRLFPHTLHLLSCVRKMSRTGLKLIIFERVVLHLPQITSVDGYDITLVHQSDPQKQYCQNALTNKAKSAHADMQQFQKNDVRCDILEMLLLFVSSDNHI